MQLYEVSFQAHYAEFTDLGQVLVVAPSKDAAIDICRAHFNIPLSSTTFNVERLKPNIYQVDRRQVRRTAEVGAAGVSAVPDGALLPAAYRADLPVPAAPKRVSLAEAHDRLPQYVVAITAGVRATSESQALKRLGNALRMRADGYDPRHSDLTIDHLDVASERSDLAARPPATQRQSIYKVNQFVSGGAGRPG